MTRASLYPESFHLVASKDSGIKSVKDLKGKRLSLDEPGSGTLVDARLILGAYGLTEKDLKAEYLKTQQAADKLKDGQFVPEEGLEDSAKVMLDKLVFWMGRQASLYER